MWSPVGGQRREFTINLITPDNGEKFLVEFSSQTLTNIQGFLSEDPDLTITINRTDLESVMIGTKTLMGDLSALVFLVSPAFRD